MTAQGERRADAVRNREAVLEAAKKALREVGPGVTVREIATRAGVGVGTVVRSFGSRDALLDSVLAGLLEPFVERAAAAAHRADTRESLVELLVELGRFQRKHHALVAAADAPTYPRASRVCTDIAHQIDALLARGKRDRSLRDDVTIADLEIALHAIGHVADRFSPARLRRFVELLVDGFSNAT